MKPLTTLILLFCLSIAALGQTEKIEVIQKKENDNVKLIVKNNSENDYQVTVKVDLYNAKVNTANPFAQVIPANSELEYMTIVPNSSGAYQYSISYTSRKLNTTVKEVTSTYNYKKDEIYIFTKQGCSRCKLTLEKLKENSVSFNEMITSGNQENNNLMWEKLSQANPYLRSVTLPVIVLNDEVFYNIPELRKFLDEFIHKN